MRRAASSADTKAPKTGAVEARAKSVYHELMKLWLPDGELRGREWFAVNPMRADDDDLGSFKFNIDSGAWGDFIPGGATGHGSIGFAAYIFNENSIDATQRVADDIGMNGATPPPKAKKAKRDKTADVELAVWPGDTPPPLSRFALSVLPPPVGVWFYCNVDSDIQAASVRYDTPKGKEFRPWKCVKATSHGFGGDGVAWKAGAPPEPRPLYNLDMLAMPDWPVVVCEGEKSADAVMPYFEAIGVTSMNGAKSPSKSNWSPLKGRDVIIWPDHDAAGDAYAIEVAGLASDAGATSVRIVEIPGGWPKGWDLADPLPSGVTHADLQQMLDDAPVWESVSGTSHDELTIGFVERHRHDLRYIAKWGIWVILGPHGWVEDEKRKAFDLARAFARDVAMAGVPLREVKAVRSAPTRAAILSMAQDDDAFVTTVDEWDADLRALNTPDGIIDLTTGVMREREPDDYVLKCTAVSPSDTADCPKWLAFLDRVTARDKEFQTYLQRICGYALTGLTVEHAMFFIYGTGQNGKGVFLRTFRGVLGKYAKNAGMETFTAQRNEQHTQEIAGLLGARLVTAQEPEEGGRWNEFRIKTMTGGDPITAHFMRENNFTYDPHFKLFIAGNHKPSLRSVDIAIRRRFNMIPFAVTIPQTERNEYLDEELKDEWPGILKWMIEGCLEWQRIGLAPPKVVTAATEEYFEAEDTFSQWLSEKCVVAGEKEYPDDTNCRPLPPDYFTSTTALFKEWDDWTVVNKFWAGSVKGFVHKMRDRKFEHVPGRQGGFLGVKIFGKESLQPKAKPKPSKY